MYNAQKPTLDELPSSARLLRSTLIALVAAVAILFTVVLPAEYGIDPTGAGRILGLTEMGEIKSDLSKEADEDKDTHGANDSQSSVIDQLLTFFVSTAQAQETWKDEITFTAAPGESAEIKLTLVEGVTVEYEWIANGGRINFDLHAHGDGESVTYEKGRGKAEGAGSITAPFAGEHGWFWRNRDKSDVTVVLKLRGDYSVITHK